MACAMLASIAQVPAMAAETMNDADAAALNLADTSAAESAAPSAPRPWKFFVQDAMREGAYRDAPSSLRNQASLGLIYQQSFGSSVGVKFSGRFDRFDPLSSAAASTRDETTIREAYATWNITPLANADAGRIDVRNGAGFGYNPTDYFKAGAVDIDVSPDPQSRRTNRLGTVGVRAQRLWDSGSVQMLFSPRLASRSEPGNPYASSDFQRTNGVNRWLFVGTQRVSATVQPQMLVYGEEGQQPQVGVNVSAVLARPLVAYAEWSGGRHASLAGEAAGQHDDAFRARSAVGASWTTPLDLTLIAEFQHSGAGSTPSQWRALQSGNTAAWGTAVQSSVTAQELPTRYGGFLMGIWRNAGMRRLDASGFMQLDQGGGKQVWLELRRHFDRFDVALQLQKQSGPSWDRYGAMRESRSVQVQAQFFE
ncbi:hypothetical protein [Caballeronia sp. BR00000012568055]|uniref:hypothetical protein n=1 Tax=Caballeronia sp. BR00000012568055 TaxID=2918761 RepID=UPI00351A880D